MAPRRPSIPIEVHAFNRLPRRLPGWPLVMAALAVVATLLIWLTFRMAGESKPHVSTEVDAVEAAGPPWRLGDPEGRFTLIFYADLECPFCRSYFPQLKRWVSDSADVTLQWHHLPLAAHEPAASTEAVLAECAAEAGGQAAFWQTVEWIYSHTRSDGGGLPEGARYPSPTPAIEQCLASGRAAAVVHTQAEDAVKAGVTTTPSLRLQDRQTGQALLLQGPVEGDALLSAIDMLSTKVPPPAEPSSGSLSEPGDTPR